MSAAKRTVIEHLAIEVPTAKPTDTVATVLQHLRSQSWETVNYVYVLQPERRLAGVVSVGELLSARNEQELHELMTREPAVVYPESEPERAGVLAIEHAIKAVPVVTKTTHEFLGVVDADEVLRILQHDHTASFLKMAGIQRSHPVVDILHASVFRLVALRLPWLLVGLAGGMLATLVSQYFEETLRTQLTLAFFIPIIVYMSDAVGTQTETIYVRSLALRQTSVLRHVWRELSIGLMLGFVMAVLTYLFAGLWSSSAAIAFPVALAMFVNVTVAPVVAFTIPTLLFWAKRDPALGAGPFTTVLQDLISLLVYFTITTLLLF